MTVSLSNSRLSVIAAIVALACGSALAACSDSNGTTVAEQFDGGKKPAPEPKPEPTPGDAGSDAASDGGSDAPEPIDAATHDASDAGGGHDAASDAGDAG